MIPQIYGFHCEEAQGGAFHVTQSLSFQLDRRLKWQTPKPRKGRRQKIVWRRRRRRYWFALALMQMTAVAKAFFGRSLVVYSQLMPIIWYIMIYGYKVNAYPNLNQTQWESKHYESSAALSIGPPGKRCGKGSWDWLYPPVYCYSAYEKCELEGYFPFWKTFVQMHQCLNSLRDQTKLVLFSKELWGMLLNKRVTPAMVVETIAWSFIDKLMSSRLVHQVQWRGRTWYVVWCV